MTSYNEIPPEETAPDSPDEPGTEEEPPTPPGDPGLDDGGSGGAGPDTEGQGDDIIDEADVADIIVPYAAGDYPVCWHFDFEEEDGTMFSIPLPSINVNAQLNLSTSDSSGMVKLMNDDIQAFFAHPDGSSVTDKRYEVISNAIIMMSPPAGAETERLIEFTVRETTGAPNNNFKLNFITGPHGTNAFDFAQLGLGLSGEDVQPELYALGEMKHEPVAQVGEIPFAVGGAMGTSVTLIDDPPIRPQVDIFPFRNVNDKILFLINGAIGDKEAVPVIIEPSDIPIFRNIYIAQGMTGAPANVTMEDIDTYMVQNPIRFKNDDPTYAYQVFRTTSAPGSYADFEDTMLAEVTEYIEEELDYPAVLASYIDDIVPNTKYYYCFRAVDIHQNISNPTVVFQIEMVDNEGQIYPIISTYQFPIEDATVAFKSGRRFIFVEPSFRQTYLNTATEGDAANPNMPTNIATGASPGDGILGVFTADKVWNKIFKLRVTSKKTGRKVDFNITFKNTGLDNP